MKHNKQMNIRMILAVLAIFSSGMAACNKKNGSPAKSRTELLTQAAWLYQSLAFYVNGEAIVIPLTDEQENFALEAVLGGSSITFNPDGTLIATGQSQVEGTWSFNNDESAIIIMVQQTVTTLTITEITETTLKGKMDAEIFLGYQLSLVDTYEVEFTFVH